MINFSFLKAKESRLIAVAVFLSALLFVVYQISPGGGRNTRPRLAQGRQTYFISSSEKGPKIMEATVDPFDPAPGDRQSMLVSASDAQPVRRVKVAMHMDHGIVEYPMALVSGSPTGGRWEASWIVSDTHDYVYGAGITAESTSGVAAVELTFR